METIFNINTLHGSNPDEFGEMLFKKLDNLSPVDLKKKIISCSIELIQNNLIHNNHRAIFKIKFDSDYYYLEITESIKNEVFKNLISDISSINQMGLDEIKRRYIKNITKKNGNTGNGFLYCRLKSSNTISILGQKSDIPEHKNTCISIKFKRS